MRCDSIGRKGCRKHKSGKIRDLCVRFPEKGMQKAQKWENKGFVCAVSQLAFLILGKTKAL